MNKHTHTRTELQDLDAGERANVLGQVGLKPHEVEEVTTFLSALPTVHVRARVEMEGEEDIMEHDIVKCSVRVNVLLILLCVYVVCGT